MNAFHRLLAVLLVLVTVVSCGGGKKPSAVKPAPLGATSTVRTIQELGAAMTAAGLTCHTTTHRASEFGACDMDGESLYNVLLTAMPAAQLDAKLAGLKSEPTTCRRGTGVLLKARYFRGANWLILDQSGDYAQRISDVLRRDGAPVC